MRDSYWFAWIVSLFLCLSPGELFLCFFAYYQVREAQSVLTGGTEKGISEVEIQLEVISSQVPDLTIVDLPGIMRVVPDGEDKDMEQKIKTIIKK